MSNMARKRKKRPYFNFVMCVLITIINNMCIKTLPIKTFITVQIINQSIFMKLECAINFNMNNVF